MPRSMRLRHPILLGLRHSTVLPLMFALMLFPSLVYEVAIYDGPGTSFRGFPLPWNSRSIAISLAKDIYIAPLLIDLMFYAALAFWAWRAIWNHLGQWPLPAKALVLTIIWLYGLGALYLIALAALIDPFFHIWYRYGVDVLSLRLGSSI